MWSYYAENNELKIRDNQILEMYAAYEYKPVKVSKLITTDNEILKFGNLEFNCIHIPRHKPGSVAYLLETEGKKILFGGDLPGIVLNNRGGDLNAYVKSMQKLLTFDIDISCEGHEKLIYPAEKVSKFLKEYIVFNENLNRVVLEDPYDKAALHNLASITYDIGFYENTLDFCKYILEIDPDDKTAQELKKKAREHNPSEMDWIKNLVKQNADFRK